MTSKNPNDPGDLVNLRIEDEMHEVIPDVEMKAVIFKRTSCRLSYIHAHEEV